MAVFHRQIARWVGPSLREVPPASYQPCSSVDVTPETLAAKLFGSLCDGAPLVACASKLVSAGLSAAVAAGDSGRAVGRAAGHLVELHLACKAVVEAHPRHAEMQQVGDDRKQRGLLAAMLGRRR